MTVFRVQSHLGAIYNPKYPRRDVARLLESTIERYSNPPSVSIQLPAERQSTLFAVHPKKDNTVVIDFRWLGIVTGLRAATGLKTAYKKAGLEAAGLAALIDIIHQISPTSPIDVVAHRFGARVALCAIAQNKTPAWQRLLISSGFEYSAPTLVALDCPQVRHMQISNILASRTQILPRVLKSWGPKPGLADYPICYGYQFNHKNWTEFAHDDPRTKRLMHDHGAIPYRTPRRPLFEMSLPA